MSRQFLYCLKREREISIKPMFSGGKTILMCTPALRRTFSRNLRRDQLQANIRQEIHTFNASARITNKKSIFYKL